MMDDARRCKIHGLRFMMRVMMPMYMRASMNARAHRIYEWMYNENGDVCTEKIRARASSSCWFVFVPAVLPRNRPRANFTDPTKCSYVPRELRTIVHSPPSMHRECRGSIQADGRHGTARRSKLTASLRRCCRNGWARGGTPGRRRTNATSSLPLALRRRLVSDRRCRGSLVACCGYCC